MITVDQALSRARDHANASYVAQGDRLEVMEGETLETAYGWVFFVNSNRYLRTRDPRDAVAGNSPLLVIKRTGEVLELGTAEPVADALKQVAAHHKLEG